MIRSLSSNVVRTLLLAAFLIALAILYLVWAENRAAEASRPSVVDQQIFDSVAAQSPSCVANWTIQNSPNPRTHHYLEDVDALAPDDIWAVGTYYTFSGNGIEESGTPPSRPAPGGGDTGTAFTIHWNGTQWSEIPSVDGSIDLYGVDALSPNDVWAVGHCAPCSMTSVTIHWDGIQWTRIDSPSPAGYITLNAVVGIASNDVWAFGANDGFHSTVAMHWDGTAWSIVPTPNGGQFGDDNVLTAATAISANDIWAVGYIYPKGGTPTTLAIHWNGTQWTRVTTPNPGNYVRTLDGVSAVSANDVWAVGQYSADSGTTYHPLFLHWNGTQWQHITATQFEDYSILRDVHAISANDVWAVGTNAVCNFCPFETLTMHWDGTAWTRVSSPNGNRDFSRLYGVTATSEGDVWSVGFSDELEYPYYSDSLIMRRLCPTTPTPSVTGTPPTATPTRTTVPSYSPTATLTVAATPTCNPYGLRILIVWADFRAQPETLRAQILAEPNVQTVDFFQADQLTPGLQLLQQYDVVVVFANLTVFADPTLLGNRLADYLDAHGIVVAFHRSWDGSLRQIGGRWVSGGYTPYQTFGGAVYETGELGNHNASHPLMADVTNLTAFYRGNLVLASGATQVAAWDDGPPLIAFKGRAIGVSAYVGDEDDGWSGQFGRVVVNAGEWLRLSGCAPVTPPPTSTPGTPTATRTPTQVLTSTPTVTPGGAGDCAVPNFAAPNNFAVGDSPERAAVGDFNHDSNLDLVVVDRGSTNISVLLGAGAGVFGQATHYDLGSEPAGVVVADFNHDNHPDIAVAGYGTNKAIVLLGDGQGGFGPMASYITGTGPQGIAVGDFNNDNNLDLVTANSGEDNMTRLLGNGSGGFGSSQDFDLDWIPLDIAVGDFDNDGNDDIAAANNFSDNVTVRLGNGTGGFGAATNYGVAAGPIGIVVADFNNDGNDDFATSSPDTSNISVRLANGSGGFGATANYPGGNGSMSIGVGDFNRDGKLDLAAANVPAGVAVLLGTGTGTFAPPVNFPAGSGPRAVAVGDFNRDGRADLAVTNTNADNVSILLNICGVAPTNTPLPTRTSPAATGTPTGTGTLLPGTTVTPTSCAITFSDVPQGHTFYPFVMCLACRDILGGYSDGTFRPNADVTRGQIAKIVSNSAGFSDPAGAQMFTDVPPGSTFYEWVQRLALREYIGGYPCGGPGEPCDAENRPYFRPGGNATRGQIAKIVSNAAGLADPVGEQIFEDVPPGSTFYEWVQRLAQREAMSGYPCGSPLEPCGVGNRPYFRPGNNATRGQTSKIVSNTFFPGCGAQAK